LFLALGEQRAEPLRQCLTTVPKLPQPAQWVHFLRNHDELDLGRLPPEQRDRVYAAFAPELKMQLYGRGIRRRLAGMLGNDRRRIEVAFSLLFSLPGTPVIYRGDALGMGDDLTLPEGWPVRTCMQWTDGPNGGFSTASDERLLHSVITNDEFGSRQVNAAAQQRDPNSLFSWLRRLTEVRQSCPEIGWGDCTLPQTDSPSILVQHHSLEAKSVLILNNLGPNGSETVLHSVPTSD
jgi:maltose alpha-D-glucosyltransferase / alpha-amylase